MANPAEGFDIHAEYFKLKREGNEYFRNDELDKAKECYLKSIQCIPAPPKEVLEILHVNLSTIYSKDDNWEKVLEHANLALELNPVDDRALFEKYRALEATGKFSEALEAITSLCCLKIRDPMYMKALDMAIMHVADLDVEEYIKNRVPSPRSKYSIDSYFKAFSSDVVAKWWRGDCPVTEDLELIRLSLSQQSLKEAAGDGDAETKFSGFVAAIVDLNCHKYLKIIDHCTEELSRPGSKLKAEAHLLRGTFRYLWGYSDADVLEDLDPITTGSLPASVELQTSAWIKRGELFTLTKNTEEMRKSYVHAQSLSPDSSDPYSAYSNSLMEADQLMEAYIQIAKAVEKSPDNPYMIGVYCFLKFREEVNHGNAMAPLEALQAFRAHLAKFPQSPELLIAFGYLFKDIREPCAAYLQFERAQDLDPENLAVAANRIMMGFETTGEVEKCLADLKELLAKDETNISGYEALATLFITTEPDFDLALETILKGLQVAKARHDFLTFSILKKTVEVRKKVIGSLQDGNRQFAYGLGDIRYDQLLLDAFGSPLD